MKLDRAIEHLIRLREIYGGDVELTCTGTGVPDCPVSNPIPKVFESTVENFRVLNEERTPSRSGKLGVRIRVCM